MSEEKQTTTQRFSRRHQTSEAHNAARAARQARVDEKAAASAERDAAAKARTPEEQLQRLDSRFGMGVGASRERRRLLGKCVRREWIINLRAQAKFLAARS